MSVTEARLARTADARAEQAEEALRRIVVTLAERPGRPARLSTVERIVLSIACDGLEIDEPMCAGDACDARARLVIATEVRSAHSVRARAAVT